MENIEKRILKKYYKGINNLIIPSKLARVSIMQPIGIRPLKYKVK